MPQEFNISDEQIEFTEKLLLPVGEHFDEERRAFIKNLNTIDLQAVPGSGKTTALLAKLLILDQYLPFSDNSGILVISHTNAAVNEIQDKIGKHCKNLFTYPNFVGTIQSFVDNFLTIPYYQNKYKKNLVRIDDEIYHEHHYCPREARAWLKNQYNWKEILLNSRLFGEDELKFGFSNRKFPLKDKTAKTYVAIVDMKKSLRDKGYLCFEDAYILGLEYVKDFSQIKKILQKRFKYVFVDEMQDMDYPQYMLLEDIFFNEARSLSKFQRIGDKNQAIFSNNESDEIWKDRGVELQLNGSHRLTERNAKVVESLALYPISVNGQMKNIDGTAIDIKPHMIVYDDTTVAKVIPKFAEVIVTLKDSGQIPIPSPKYKAIGWTTLKEDGKIRICDYFPSYSRATQAAKIDYSHLEEYLNDYPTSETLARIRKGILNAVIKIMRMEGIHEESGHTYTKRRLLNHLEKENRTAFEDIRLKLYLWSIGIIKGQKNQVLQDIRKYIPEFLTLFGKTVEQSKDFINGTTGNPEQPGEPAIDINNLYEQDGVKIEVTTVHSVKGQTHTGTLYMETFYERESGNYESERLSQQIKGIPFVKNAHHTKRIIQSAKMMYVGLSRPTHLLCLAVHKKRYDSHLSDLSSDNWEIINLC